MGGGVIASKEIPSSLLCIMTHSPKAINRYILRDVNKNLHEKVSTIAAFIPPESQKLPVQQSKWYDILLEISKCTQDRCFMYADATKLD